MIKLLFRLIKSKLELDKQNSINIKFLKIIDNNDNLKWSIGIMLFSIMHIYLNIRLKIDVKINHQMLFE